MGHKGGHRYNHGASIVTAVVGKKAHLGTKQRWIKPVALTTPKALFVWKY